MNTMTEPVNPLGKVVEALYRQLGERGASAIANASKDQPQNIMPASADIPEQVRGRLYSLSLADPGFYKKGRRLFLQAVLAAEFGETLVNDAAFHKLVEGVACMFEEDDEFLQSLNRLVERLHNEAVPKNR